MDLGEIVREIEAPAPATNAPWTNEPFWHARRGGKERDPACASGMQVGHRGSEGRRCPAGHEANISPLPDG